MAKLTELPEKWCVRRTRETANEINTYFGSDLSYVPTTECYDFVHSEKVSDGNLNITLWGTGDDSKAKGFTEISMGDFRTLVINKPKTTKTIMTKQFKTFDIKGSSALLNAIWKELIAMGYEGVSGYSPTDARSTFSISNNTNNDTPTRKEFLQIGAFTYVTAKRHSFVLPAEWNAAIKFAQDQLIEVPTYTPGWYLLKAGTLSKPTMDYYLLNPKFRKDGILTCDNYIAYASYNSAGSFGSAGHYTLEKVEKTLPAIQNILSKGHVDKISGQIIGRWYRTQISSSEYLIKYPSDKSKTENIFNKYYYSSGNINHVDVKYLEELPVTDLRIQEYLPAGHVDKVKLNVAFKVGEYVMGFGSKGVITSIDSTKDTFTFYGLDAKNQLIESNQVFNGKVIKMSAAERKNFMMTYAKVKYPVGTKYQTLTSGRQQVKTQEFEYKDSDLIWGDPGRGCIFENGKWAPIIQTLSFGKQDFTVDKVKKRLVCGDAIVSATEIKAMTDFISALDTQMYISGHKLILNADDLKLTFGCTTGTVKEVRAILAAYNK